MADLYIVPTTPQSIENWKPIDSMQIAEELSAGRFIANAIESPEDIYEVQSIAEGYVTAVHSNGKVELKMFPEEDLINGKWWVKE